MMAAVHYKFKSSKDYKSLVIEGPSISVADLKLTIVESMHLKRPANFILLVFDAQTNEVGLANEENDSHDFGDLQIQDSSSRAYQCFGGFMDGRMSTRDRAPHAGYICRRCNIPGHFIWDCPTNGDPNYDIKKLKPPTGIPKSMLMTTSDGSYALTGGVVAALKPDEATFEREVEGLPSTRSAIDIPAELHCPLCKGVMKDAVMTGKCCYRSFCDKCIRDCIISKSMCACGATNILADDLVPNKNVRDLLESCQLAKPPLPSHSADLKRKREIEHIIERLVSSRKGMVFLGNNVAIHDETRGLEGDAIFLTQGNKNV
ncbi:hypothetical protein Syun_029244 [Stephania yunnanensis]|uniref:DWNN domain-containing protein n=1 Tax=Stephania yunnanensis TaxID=152371 RepID=A0AAP0HL71_9MAGN